jgi:hypothetical protein
MPKLFQKKDVVLEQISRNPSCYNYISALVIFIINVPWMILALDNTQN